VRRRFINALNALDRAKALEILGEMTAVQAAIFILDIPGWSNEQLKAFLK